MDEELYCATTRCIKHLKRYGTFDVPDDILHKILIFSLKGQSCEEDHFDIAQRDSIYHYFKGKEITNPYIMQFIKDTEKRFKCITL